jgi:hypothetical protein
VAKLLALWLNSTLGILLLLSEAETTRGPWVKFKKRPLHTLPVVDFTRLTSGEVVRLRQAYDNLAQQKLQALPIEFATPQTRQRIDNAFSDGLHLDSDLTSLYRLLARDPIITCKPLSRVS